MDLATPGITANRRVEKEYIKIYRVHWLMPDHSHKNESPQRDSNVIEEMLK
jgi:hypothetical protein